MTTLSRMLRFGLAVAALAHVMAAARAADPLTSWNDGPRKSAIVEFVGKVTREGSPDFVPPTQRIAVFDNDGTLWAEQPMYFQLIFALDRVKALAPQHPEWKTKEPFASLLKGDVGKALAGGEKAIAEIVMATHAGMTTEEFERIVKDWIATAKHPKTGRLFTEMVYQPMLELLAYLRANGFKTYIVSGGGIEFMRPWTEAVYGIPPEQVVGSSIKTKYESARRQAGSGSPAGAQLHRRQGRQAGRHQLAHRQAADCCLRQLRWRPADARMDAGSAAAPGWGCWSITTTPRASGPTTESRASARSSDSLMSRRQDAGLDRHQHEGRLEDGLRRTALTAVLHGVTRQAAS